VAGQLYFCESRNDVPQRQGLVDEDIAVGQEKGGHEGVELGLAQRRSECAEGVTLVADAFPKPALLAAREMTRSIFQVAFCRAE
jgi:hypothetical protein